MPKALVRRCPTCGAIHTDSDKLFAHSPVKRKLMELIQKNPGLGRAELLSRLYAGSAGPEWESTLSSHIFAMNRQLAPLGLRIVGRPGNGGGDYRLTELSRKVGATDAAAIARKGR